MTRCPSVAATFRGARLAMVAASFPAIACGQSLTVEAAVDSALASHPSVLAAVARVDGADAARSAAKAAYLPSLLASAGASRFEEPMVVAPLHGFDPTQPPDFNHTLVQGQIGLELTVFDGGARGAGSRTAAAAALGAREGRNAVAMELIERVVGTYVAALAARDVREAANHQVEALASEHSRAEQRLREGTAARVEVMRAEAALLDAQAQVASADARVGVAERALARIMGVDPASVVAAAMSDVTVVAEPAESDGPHPGLEAARQATLAARGRVDRERAARLPTLRASAGLLTFGSAAGSYASEWQTGLRVTWPLFTGGARSAAIDRARADLRVAEEEQRAKELEIAGSLDRAEAAVAESGARARALAASVRQWEEVARIEVLSLETGAGIQQDYLRAEAALFQARAGHSRARYDEILARVARARAQGHLDRDWIDEALETSR